MLHGHAGKGQSHVAALSEVRRMAVGRTDQKRDGFHLSVQLQVPKAFCEFPSCWPRATLIEGDAVASNRCLEQALRHRFAVASLYDGELVASVTSQALEVILHACLGKRQGRFACHNDLESHREKSCLRWDVAPASFVRLMNDIYEDQKILDEYLLFHYGKHEDILDPGVRWPEGMLEALDFAKRTQAHFSKSRVSRALDLGCAVGASTFEMSRHCDEVIGIDFSQSFINAANRIRSEGGLSYSRLQEARVKTSHLASLEVPIDPSKISFQQGDAMHLPEQLGSFDRVHAANLLCRLSAPMLLLERLPGLVKPGGELVLATPCTWLEAFTPPENWPDAAPHNRLKTHLAEAFELQHECDEPFLIRETARKFQWTRSMLTLWIRKTGH